MVPFLATLEFRTPLILKAATTLDAILVAEMAIHLGDEAALASVPLKQTGGVYHASQIYLDAVNWRIPIAKANLRRNEPQHAPLPLLKGNARGNRIVTSHNHQKNTLNSYEAQVVRAAHFGGTGDVAAIRDILADIRAVGLRRADGMGMVAAVVVAALDNVDETRWGLADPAGEPMRPVPLDMWDSLGGIDDPLIQAVRYRPFYWDTRNAVVPCAVPAHNSATRLLATLSAGEGA